MHHNYYPVFQGKIRDLGESAHKAPPVGSEAQGETRDLSEAWETEWDFAA